MMNEEDFKKLQDSIIGAGEIKAGRLSAARCTVVDYPDIKEIRGNLDLTQNEFAMLIGVSVRTLQNWEQHRREPEGPAKALLKVAEHNPKAVMDALSA